MTFCYRLVKKKLTHVTAFKVFPDPWIDLLQLL